VLASCAPTTQYGYAHLPAGYNWRAVYDEAANVVVFYGQDPLTNDTLHWKPHDAR
jgi:hypothetical protein